MNMPTTFPPEFLLQIEKQIDIKAPADVVFETILSMDAMQKTPNGDPMNFKLEPWPGGRWYRDMGNNTGHFWGHVQVIKPPLLLELNGPMFMSYPAISHVQYKLKENQGVTTLTILHRAIGMIQDDHRTGVQAGWQSIITAIKEKSER